VIRPFSNRLALVVALCALAPTASRAQGDGLALRIDQPAEQQPIVADGSGMVVISGRINRGASALVDLIFVLDVSESTALASGVDVDGDGEQAPIRIQGVLRSLLARLPRWTLPPDSVLAAEISATRRALERLDARETRVGIVTPHADDLSEAARTDLAVPLTQDYASVRAGLDAIRAGGAVGNSYFERGMVTAGAALRAEPGDRQSARRRIVLLADGSPPPVESIRGTLETASALGRSGIRIDTLGIFPDPAREGPSSLRGTELMLKDVAKATGGSYQRVGPGDDLRTALLALARDEYASIAIENITTGAAATQIDVGLDGSFYALVPVQTGVNRVVAAVRWRDGMRVGSSRDVRVER